MQNFLRIIALLAGLAIITVGHAAYVHFLKPQNTISNGPRSVIIPKGSGTSSIAKLLKQHDLLVDDFYFKLAAAAFGYDKKLKAGKFAFKSGATNEHMLKILYIGESVKEKVTIPEGLIAKKIASILQRDVNIDSAAFMQLVNSKTQLQKYGLEGDTFEGYLFPETYFLPWGMSAAEALEVLVLQFKAQLPDSFSQKAARFGLSAHQAITLASIVEGEAMLDSERAKIAALYHNRLKKGWKLAADPTIQYFVPNGPRRLLNADLAIDSPYNTYLYAGLPPGPINNPGRRSLEATVNPESTPYLFMVAKGDGSHTFSVTFAKHQQAKREFDKYRRKIARQERAAKQKGKK